MATSDQVKVLGLNVSPCANRVQIALNLKGVNYEVTDEDLFNKSELLLASNPVYKKIPVLIHADKPLCESLLILEYIDEVWTNEPRILPLDPFDRAVARFWAAYLDGLWIPQLMGLRDHPPAEEEAKAKVIAKISEGLVLLEGAFVECSKGKAFFGGDDIGYFDIVFGPYFRWIGVVEILGNVKLMDESKIPRLLEWYQRFSSHKAVKDVLVPPQKLMQVLAMFRARGWYDPSSK